MISNHKNNRNGTTNMNIQRKHWVIAQITAGILFLVPALFATDVAPPASEDGNMVFDAGRQPQQFLSFEFQANILCSWQILGVGSLILKLADLSGSKRRISAAVG